MAQLNAKQRSAAAVKANQSRTPRQRRLISLKAWRTIRANHLSDNSTFRFNGKTYKVANVTGTMTNKESQTFRAACRAFYKSPLGKKFTLLSN